MVSLVARTAEGRAAIKAAGWESARDSSSHVFLPSDPAVLFKVRGSVHGRFTRQLASLGTLESSHRWCAYHLRRLQGAPGATTRIRRCRNMPQFCLNSMRRCIRPCTCNISRGCWPRPAGGSRCLGSLKARSPSASTSNRRILSSRTYGDTYQ